MSGYEFRVYDIDWEAEPASKMILPNEAVVWLGKWLVEADTINDEEWDKAINEELMAQFDACATGFSFEPYEPDEDEDEE